MIDRKLSLVRHELQPIESKPNMNDSAHVHLARFHAHACQTMTELLENLQKGCSPKLALAFATTNLGLFKVANTTPYSAFAANHRLVRMLQAFQIAVAHFEAPETEAAMGKSQAEAVVKEYLDMIREASS